MSVRYVLRLKFYFLIKNKNKKQINLSINKKIEISYFL